MTAFARGTLSASSHNGGVLDTVSSPSTTQSWTLDAVGNQTAVTTDGTTVDNTANSKNELNANGSSDLAFDNNGNTVTDQSDNTYSFDAWNHIATVKNSSSTTIAGYTYDAAGRRITEDEGGATTDLFYNGSQIIEQRQSSTVTDQYVYNLDFTNDVLLRDNNSTSGSLGISGSGLGRRLFEQHDANFDATALTNTSGVVVQRMTYGPYGTMTVLSPSWASATDAYSFNPGFQGMWRDSVTGLYYTPNRDYDPATGTWREPDPTGYPNGSNSFEAYCSSPAASLDPSGCFVDPGSRSVVGLLQAGFPPAQVAEMTGLTLAQVMRIGVTTGIIVLATPLPTSPTPTPPTAPPVPPFVPPIIAPMAPGVAASSSVAALATAARKALEWLANRCPKCLTQMINLLAAAEAPYKGWQNIVDAATSVGKVSKFANQFDAADDILKALTSHHGDLGQALLQHYATLNNERYKFNLPRIDPNKGVNHLHELQGMCAHIDNAWEALTKCLTENTPPGWEQAVAEAVRLVASVPRARCRAYGF